MKTLFTVAWHSLLSRKKTLVLTFLSLTISIVVLFSVEHIRLQAKESFNRTVSGVDLIVGAPSGQLNLLLYSVFRMGSPTNNIDYNTFQMLQEHKLVEWAIPISLGDSHRGFRVMGTTNDYFAHYQYGRSQALSFEQGQAFEGLFEAVIGADVAKTLNYKVGDKIVIAHGIGSTSFTNHDQAPFVISGIMSATGTPVDKTVHVPLSAIDAIHMSPAALKAVFNNPQSFTEAPKSVTAVMLGLSSKFAIFGLQRDLNNYEDDRLMAVLPGVAMAELWNLMSTVENLLRAISALVLMSSLFGLCTMLLASMNERRGEIAVFRVLGAGPQTILLMILLEALIIAVLAIVCSAVLLSLGLLLLKDWLASEYGLFLSHNIMSPELLITAALVLLATIIVSIIPGVEAYKNALHAQLSGS